MKKTILTSVMVLLLMTTGLSFTAQAANVKAKSAAKITADQVGYLDENRQIEAKGHVLITYDDTVIKADYAIIDQELNSMLAKGNVKLTKKDSVFSGDRLYYYFNTRQGWMSPIKSEIKDEGEINGALKLTAEEANLKGEEILVKKSAVSGCDRPHPHYHFSAEEVEYYPEERIVLRKAWYWEGRVRLFYFPKLSISLDGTENNFELPEIGYNDSDGWWMKWGYNYYINQSSYGRAYIDKISEQGGDGVGLKHYWKPNDTSYWYHDFSYTDKGDLDYPKDDYEFGLGYKNWKNSKANYELNAVNRHRFTATGEPELENFYNLYFLGNSPWPYFKVFLRENEEHYTAPVNGFSQDTLQEKRLNTTWSYQLGNSFTLNTSANYDFTKYLNQQLTTEQFIYTLNASKSWKTSNLQLAYNNSSISGNGSDYQSINSLPELTYTLSNLQSPLLKDLELKLQYTNLEKTYVEDGKLLENRTESGIRRAVDLTKRNTLWQSDQSKWSFNLTSLMQYRTWDATTVDSATLVKTQDQNDIAALKETVDAKYNFTQYFAASLGVGYTVKHGPTSNDFFSKGDDYILPGGSVTSTWTWNSPKVNANLNGSYSFYDNAPQPVYFNLTCNPAPSKSFSLNTEYDWEDGWGQSNLSLEYRPNDNWKITSSLGYNPELEMWTKKEFQAVIKQKLSSKLQVELAGVYDVFQNDWGVANAGLDYEWHCRDLKFYYDYVEKEYWVLISFKAFPGMDVKLSSDPDDLYYWYLN